MRVWFLLFLVSLVLSSCAERGRRTASAPAPRLIQVGEKFLAAEAPDHFEGVKSSRRVRGGWLLEPEKGCLRVKKASAGICLKPLPRVFPHLRLERVDSYGVDLRIVSLFPQVALFIWEEGRPPDLFHPRLLSPGEHTLRDLYPGRTYLLSAAVVFGKDLYGPLSPPLRLEVRDEDPPLPPQGGGYILEGDRITLVWDPSPSRDVSGYLVEEGGRVLRVKETFFRERVPRSEGVIIYEIRAVDGAGLKSTPLTIRVNLSQGGGDGKEAGFHPH